MGEIVGIMFLLSMVIVVFYVVYDSIVHNESKGGDVL